MNTKIQLWAIFGAWLIVLPVLTATAEEVQIEEIIVTAQHRQERLQDVPVSVTAFGQNEIVDAGINSTQDLINLTPNVTLDDSFTVGNTFLQVRGVAQINNADSPMAIVVDGVPQNNQKQFKQELFDIERIEIVRGPQGSLYGRNAIGGAINIVTRQPTNEPEGSFWVGGGNGGLRSFGGTLSGAVVDDTLLYRLSGGWKDLDGVTTNTVLNEQVDFATIRDIRGRLTWNVSDSLTLDLRYSHSDSEGGCCSDTFVENPDWDSAGSPNPNRTTFTEPHTNVRGQTTGKLLTDASIKADWTLGGVVATYIVAHSTLEEGFFGDLDFTDGVTTSLGGVLTPTLCIPAFNSTCGFGQQGIVDIELTSHELRFTSPDEQRFRWLAGAYYLNMDRYAGVTGFLDLPGTTARYSTDGWVPFVENLEINDNRAWALFGQVEYDIMTDLELSIGLRYDEDERDHTGLLPIATSPKETFRDLQPRVVLTRRWTEDLLTYAGYSRGFRSGGFNSPGTGSRQFDEETLDNFEVGLKSTWFDRRLQLNGAIFYAISDDFQFFFVDATTASQVIDNIDEVEIFGTEIEVQALLNDRWMIFGSLGYTDTEIKESSARPQDVGNRAPKNQVFTLNTGIQYSIMLSDSLQAKFRADYEHRGDKYWHPDNLNPMEDFGLLNGRVSLESQVFSIDLWVKNLLDELYWEDYNATAFSGLPLGDIGWLSRGRTYGGNFTYRF